MNLRNWIEDNLESPSGWQRSAALLVKIIWEALVTAILPVAVSLLSAGFLTVMGASPLYALSATIIPVGVGGTGWLFRETWCFLSD